MDNVSHLFYNFLLKYLKMVRIIYLDYMVVVNILLNFLKRMDKKNHHHLMELDNHILYDF